MKKGNKLKELLEKKGFYVALYSCAAVIVVIAGIISFNNINSLNTPKPEPQSPNAMIEDETSAYEVNQSNVKSYHDSETTTNKITSEKVTENPTEITTVSQKQTTKEDKQTTTEQPSKTTGAFSMFDETKEMSWPVSGQIVMDYSTETAIYDKTLEQYRTNDSICIAADVGTEVKAAAEGIVEKIFSDKENGKSIVLNHGNGWLTTYSQLEETVLVKEGQIVGEGELIGKVGNPSNYSIMLGSHLDFKLSKDETAQDPKLVLAQYDE